MMPLALAIPREGEIVGPCASAARTVAASDVSARFRIQFLGRVRL